MAAPRDEVVEDLPQRLSKASIWPLRRPLGQSSSDAAEFALSGGLLSYGGSLSDGLEKCGLYVARILNGEKPSDLPVIQPTKFDLIINLRAAKALGLDIPPTVLASATEVIE
jgi:ABC-type uncharacterized transport system substrate-binding protein